MVSQEDFIKLFVRYERELRYFARLLLPTWTAVDDVLQESSVIMWKKIDQLEDSEDFLVWARVILRYEALRYRRDKGREKLVFDENIYELLAADENQGTRAFPEEYIEALRGCINKMKIEHQKLIFTPYLGPGSVKQIAEISGRSPNSLYKLLCKLRSKLYGCVAGKLEEPLRFK